MNRRLCESAGDVAMGTRGINTTALTGEFSTVALKRRRERKSCLGVRRGQKPEWFVVGSGEAGGQESPRRWHGIALAF